MQKISAKILKQRMTESNIWIAGEPDEKLEINMDCKANLKTSKKLEEKNVLLNMQLDISAKEELKILLNADVVFELEQLPDDYEKVAERELVPMACEALLNSLDDMLVVMGYNKLELANEIRRA